MLISYTMTDLSQRLNDHENDPTQIVMRQTHITKWRYRVYTFILVVVIILIEPMFTSALEDVRWKWAFGISFTDPMSMITKRGEGWKLNELDELQKQIDETNEKIAQTNQQIEIVKKLEIPEKQATILNCVNRWLCDGMWALLSRIDLLRSFLMIEWLTADKLNFDQKFVLRNINEFLTAQPGRGKLVDINSITFSTPVEIVPEYKLNKISIMLDVSYLVNTDFMQFLNNIESKVHQDLPVMWRIEAVNYDIVNYLDTQDVSMTLAVYYLNTPKENLLIENGQQNTGDQLVDGNEVLSGAHASALDTE